MLNPQKILIVKSYNFMMYFYNPTLVHFHA